MKKQNKIKDLNRLTFDDSNEKYMKIKFNSDDDLPLKKTLELDNIITVVTSVFYDNIKYYLQFFQMIVCSNYLNKA